MLKDKNLFLKVFIIILYIANLSTNTFGHYILTDSERFARDAASTPEGCQISSDVLESAELKCELNGATVDCSKPTAENTVVTIKCKPFYESTKSSNSPSVCQNNAWSHTLLQCVPECGAFVQKTPLIINDASAPKGNSPWHVGIYRKNSDKYEYLCGGTIISKNIVFSAAHCFTEPEVKLMDITKYFVAAGKYYSDYDASQDTSAQKRHVKAVALPPIYKGYLTNYAGDISIVTVDVPFEINNLVKPVCVDWNNEFEKKLLQPKSLGKAAGWGYTSANQKVAEKLKELTIPYVDLQTCLDTVPEGFLKFVTADKFCAGYTNGTSLCNGDAGGGLIFKNDENQKSFILGVISNGPAKDGKCDPNYYTAFTKVSHYLDFIKNVH